jgi:hypothetical protein
MEPPPQKTIKLTVKCWNSHALKMLVATLGNMPRFFWFFFPFVSSSSSPVPSPLPILALLASPKTKQYHQAKKIIDKKAQVCGRNKHTDTGLRQRTADSKYQETESPTAKSRDVILYGYVCV